MDSYDAIHEGTLPSGEVFDYWAAKLQCGEMTDCLSAIEYFNTLPEPAAPAELVIDAMERFLRGRIVDSKENCEPCGQSGCRHDVFSQPLSGLRTWLRLLLCTDHP